MTAEKPSKLHMISPRYWATWFYIGLLYLVSCLPWRIQFGLGRLLGRLLHADRRLHHIAKTNITRCFPDLDPDQSRSLVRKNFAQLGIDLIESLSLWSRKGFKLAQNNQVEGLEHLQAALGQGRGIILLGSHFSNVDMGAVLLAHIGKKQKLFNFTATYREQKNPVFDWLMKQGRSCYFKQVIPVTEIRPLVRELKNKNIVWFAPDMDMVIDRKNAVFAPFMGIEAATTTSIHRLSKLTGALVIPYANYRAPNRFEYRLKIFPPLNDFPSDDIVADTTRINQLVERLVKQEPESYLWILRRFKTRPAGEVPFY